MNLIIPFQTNSSYSPTVTEYLKSLNKTHLSSPLLKYKRLRISSPKRLKSKVIVLDQKGTMLLLRCLQSSNLNCFSPI